VPEHIHLLFLPPHSPELQPAVRHEEELEDAQFAQCAASQARPELIRSTTRFHWWPKQIHKQLGPRGN
jgi:transposase